RRPLLGGAERPAPQGGLQGPRQPDRQEAAAARGDRGVRGVGSRAVARRLRAIRLLDEATAVRRALIVAFVAAVAAAALSAGPAGAMDECNGLRVCLPVDGPWVVADARGADWELSCPLPGYVIGGTDARVATRDVDVSFRAEIGSPI